MRKLRGAHVSGNCPSCDFCTHTEDGVLMCALIDRQVHGYETCSWWQSETRIVDGDNWFEVMKWPARRKKSHRS